MWLDEHHNAQKTDKSKNKEDIGVKLLREEHYDKDAGQPEGEGNCSDLFLVQRGSLQLTIVYSSLNLWYCISCLFSTMSDSHSRGKNQEKGQGGSKENYHKERKDKSTKDRTVDTKKVTEVTRMVFKRFA
jgi:hypothetical protein